VSREAVGVAVYDASMAEAFERFRRSAWPRAGRRETGAPSLAPTSPDAPVFVFVKGSDIIGHLATIPVQVASSGATVAAHWIVGFMVLAEHRNGLVGPLLVREATRALDCALSLFVEPPVQRILTGMKWSHRGVLSEYLRVLDARALTRNVRMGALRRLSAPARLLAGWALALLQAARSLQGRLARPKGAPGAVREEQGFDAGFDVLWHSVRDRFGACVSRDRESLRRRYGGRPESYRVLACREGPRLLGYCIVKVKQFSGDPRMGDLRLGTIVDCLFDPSSPEVMQSLLSEALGLFRREGVQAVLCTASHAAVTRLLRANGFLAIPGNLNFALHNRTPMPLLDIPLGSWHLMRGDSDADQNF
jgi:hypothetical protein